MAESKEIQASGEGTSECIKAQACPVELRRNLTLEIKIRYAEQQLKSKMKALESVNSANVELQKELLLAKERKQETFERVKKGIKKYEELWLQCKSRYESIPYVQEWLEKSKKIESFKETISSLHNEILRLTKEIEDKKEFVLQQDRKTIIDLAQYLARDRPQIIKLLEQKSTQVQNLSEAIDEVAKENDEVKTL